MHGAAAASEGGGAFPRAHGPTGSVGPRQRHAATEVPKGVHWVHQAPMGLGFAPGWPEVPKGAHQWV